MKGTLAIIIASLALVVAIAGPLWLRSDFQKRLVPLAASVSVLERTAQTNRALIEAQATQSNTPLPPVVTDAEWRAAWNGVPACGGLEQVLPDTDDLKVLGLQTLLGQGFTAARLCRDTDVDHIAFIFAKEELSSVGPGTVETCVDSCDKVVFGVIDGETKSLRYLESGNKLGIFAEAYDQYCLIDKIMDTAQHGSERLLFYCGSGESGGLSHWYQYEFAGDRLTTVQTMTELGPPEKFEVRDAELLKAFLRQSN